MIPPRTYYGGYDGPQYPDKRFCWAFDSSGIPCAAKSPRHNSLCDYHEALTEKQGLSKKSLTHPNGG